MKRNLDAILVLGVELGEGDQPTKELRMRACEAARVWHGLGMDALQVMACGGILPGHGAAEADVIAELLMGEGVSDERIIRERKSRNTMENFLRAGELLGSAKGKRVLVVTSDYHLRRALMTARRAGFWACGQAAVLEHDEAWEACKKKELAYTVDLLMGWQDEGKSRPQWTYTLFDAVFGKRR